MTVTHTAHIRKRMRPYQLALNVASSLHGTGHYGQIQIISHYPEGIMFVVDYNPERYSAGSEVAVLADVRKTGRHNFDVSVFGPPVEVVDAMNAIESARRVRPPGILYWLLGR